jgi:hypothetical protein
MFCINKTEFKIPRRVACIKSRDSITMVSTSTGFHISLSVALILCTIVINDAFLRASMPSTAARFRNSLTMKVSNQVPTSSIDSARSYSKQISSAAALLLPILAFSTSAKAGLFMSDEQESVNSLAIFQKPVYDLLEQLRAGKDQVLKGGVEDSNVVQQNMNIYIVPLQAKMAEVAPKLKLADAANQSRIELLPLLMKGHILELTQAIKEGKAPSQFKEVEEVQETLAEYLKLASSKYTVAAFIPPRPFTDAEFFGPFGCEYWGKKRVEGTNKCEVIPEK